MLLSEPEIRQFLLVSTNPHRPKTGFDQLRTLNIGTSFNVLFFSWSWLCLKYIGKNRRVKTSENRFSEVIVILLV